MSDLFFHMANNNNDDDDDDDDQVYQKPTKLQSKKTSVLW